MFGFGITEILVILVLVLVLFGAGKIPSVMADLGKGIQSFKKAVNEDATPAARSQIAKKPTPKAKKRG
jgi:sec-independent protein translocase protein TatA